MRVRIAVSSRSASVGFLVAIVGVLLGGFAGCGDDTVTGPGNGDVGPMSATIDGQAWTATATNITAKSVPGVAGAFIIEGTHIVSGTDALTILISLTNVAGPGTYPLGVTPTVFGGTASVTTLTSSWTTPLSGAAGSITITTLTVNHIVGTFAFNATPSVGNATGTRAVTNGSFDLTLDTGGTLLPLPENHGSRVTATFTTRPFAAATVVAQMVSNTLIVSASNNDYTVSFQVSSVTAPGTYPLGDVPLRSITIGPGADGAPDGICCWGAGSGATGTITISSITDARVIGTFTASLAANGTASAPLGISNGILDIGLP